MDSCKYTYSNYIGAGKSDHEKLMLRLDKLEKEEEEEEETSNNEISESEKKRITSGISHIKTVLSFSISL